METIVTKQPAISVIIPVFNAAAYLNRCLDSLTGQTLSDIEIICINDGSTDNSPDILNAYTAKDPRIKIINQPNSGQSAARNTGITKATGQYIGFVDADDYADSDFYEKLYQAALNSKADIVQTSTRRIGYNRTKIKKRFSRNINDFASAIKNLNHGGVWDKIFRTDMIKNNHITFLDGRIYEDNLFAIQALWFGKGMKIINTTCYNYIFNPHSTTTSPEKEQKRRQDSLAIASMIIDFAIQQKMSESEIKELQIFILNNFINVQFLNEPEYFLALQKALHSGSIVSRHQKRQKLKKAIKQIRHKIKAIFN